MLWRKGLVKWGVALFFGVGQIAVPHVQAGELVVHGGGSVTVQSGSTLLMNCNDLTVEADGAFVVDGGEVHRRGRLILEEGGQYEVVSGWVDKCYKSYFVIPGPEGGAAVICL